MGSGSSKNKKNDKDKKKDKKDDSPNKDDNKQPSQQPPEPEPEEPPAPPPEDEHSKPKVKENEDKIIPEVIDDNEAEVPHDDDRAPFVVEGKEFKMVMGRECHQKIDTRSAKPDKAEAPQVPDGALWVDESFPYAVAMEGQETAEWKRPGLKLIQCLRVV